MLNRRRSSSFSADAAAAFTLAENSECLRRRHLDVVEEDELLVRGRARRHDELRHRAGGPEPRLLAVVERDVHRRAERDVARVGQQQVRPHQDEHALGPDVDARVGGLRHVAGGVHLEDAGRQRAEARRPGRRLQGPRGAATQAQRPVCRRDRRVAARRERQDRVSRVVERDRASRQRDRTDQLVRARQRDRAAGGDRARSADAQRTRLDDGAAGVRVERPGDRGRPEGRRSAAGRGRGQVARVRRDVQRAGRHERGGAGRCPADGQPAAGREGRSPRWWSATPSDRCGRPR